MHVKILYEDNHLIAVEKPAGVLTQPDYSADLSMLDLVKKHIKHRDNKPGKVFLGMVQRLDKPVSGVLFFAKTSKAAGRVSEQIRNRKTEKLYLALTEKHGDKLLPGHWNEFQAFLARDKDTTRIVQSSEEGKNGILRAKILFEKKDIACLLVKLITGRKHQIRAQLSYLGYPIIGDEKYGSVMNQPKKKAIALHALYGAITHPTTKMRVGIITRLPDYFDRYFTSKEIDQIRKRLGDIDLEVN